VSAGRLVRGLDGGDLGLQRLNLGFKRCPAFFADAPRGFGGVARLDRLLETAGGLLQLRERRRCHLRDARQRLDAEVHLPTAFWRSVGSLAQRFRH
jgi:hypothetical protein